MNKDLKPLSVKTIHELIKKYPGWGYKNNKLIKTFLFRDFSDGLNFLNKLIPFCNKIDHHPDVHIYYKKFIFELSRYSIGGKVTMRDFTIAKKIEDLYKKRF